MIDVGTKCKLSAECRLGRGNIQFQGILDLFSKPKISWFNSLVDLKVQSKHCDIKRPVRIFTKFLMWKDGLHLNSKPDNKCVSSEDITFLSEIITNSRY